MTYIGRPDRMITINQHDSQAFGHYWPIVGQTNASFDDTVPKAYFHAATIHRGDYAPGVTDSWGGTVAYPYAKRVYNSANDQYTVSVAKFKTPIPITFAWPQHLHLIGGITNGNQRFDRDSGITPTTVAVDRVRFMCGAITTSFSVSEFGVGTVVDWCNSRFDSAHSYNLPWSALDMHLITKAATGAEFTSGKEWETKFCPGVFRGTLHNEELHGNIYGFVFAITSISSNCSAARSVGSYSIGSNGYDVLMSGD